MTKKFRVTYWRGDGLHSDEPEQGDATLEFEILSWKRDTSSFIAAMNEARAKILDDMAIDYDVTEIKE